MPSFIHSFIPDGHALRRHALRSEWPFIIIIIIIIPDGLRAVEGMGLFSYYLLLMKMI